MFSWLRRKQFEAKLQANEIATAVEIGVTNALARVLGGKDTKRPQTTQQQPVQQATRPISEAGESELVPAADMLAAFGIAVPPKE